MTASASLPLFTNAHEDHQVIPRYHVKLVTESRLHYNGERITSARMISDFLQGIGFHEQATEEFHALYLNTKHQVIGTEMISKGTLNASLVHPREVFKGALLANAHSLIIAHNHPSGDVNPSGADKQVTQKLVDAGNLMDIQILDHVIIGSTGSYFSFRDNSLIIS